MDRFVRPSFVRSELPDPLEWERRLGKRPDRQPQEQQRIIVTRGPVQVELVASDAAVDQDPFAVSANGDGDRLHEGTAARGSIASHLVVQVPAPQAVRTVVPEGGPWGATGHLGLTVPTAESELLDRSEGVLLACHGWDLRERRWETPSRPGGPRDQEERGRPEPERDVTTTR
jgi:hypothetical protein